MERSAIPVVDESEFPRRLRRFATEFLSVSDRPVVQRGVDLQPFDQRNNIYSSINPRVLLRKQFRSVIPADAGSFDAPADHGARTQLTTGSPRSNAGFRSDTGIDHPITCTVIVGARAKTSRSENDGEVKNRTNSQLVRFFRLVANCSARI
jgi:hypothetical protein